MRGQRTKICEQWNSHRDLSRGTTWLWPFNAYSETDKFKRLLHQRAWLRECGNLFAAPVNSMFQGKCICQSTCSFKSLVSTLLLLPLIRIWTDDGGSRVHFALSRLDFFPKRMLCASLDLPSLFCVLRFAFPTFLVHKRVGDAARSWLIEKAALALLANGGSFRSTLSEV